MEQHMQYQGQSAKGAWKTEERTKKMEKNNTAINEMRKKLAQDERKHDSILLKSYTGSLNCSHCLQRIMRRPRFFMCLGYDHL